MAKKKVFISWSGSPSREIAVALGDWLEEVYDGLTTWVSERDIEAGARSMAEIERSLADAVAGIIVVTRRNMSQPWINFEAGALSKHLDESEHENRVIPLLVDFHRPAELKGPMSILQAVLLDHQGIHAILKSLNGIMELDPDRAEKRLGQYWPALKEQVEPLKKLAFEQEEAPSGPYLPSTTPENENDTSEMIPEMLEILRSLRDERDVGRFGIGSGSGSGLGATGRRLRGEALTDYEREVLHQQIRVWLASTNVDQVIGSPALSAGTVNVEGKKYTVAIRTERDVDDNTLAVYNKLLRADLGRDDIIIFRAKENG